MGVLEFGREKQREYLKEIYIGSFSTDLMGVVCDFCGVQGSLVHCEADDACLCLACDQNVHSANAISMRHSRAFLCQRCNSQGGVVRCKDENTWLCQTCDWTVHHENSTCVAPPTMTSDKQDVNCYSGCPSPAELFKIWTFPPVEFRQETMSLTTIDKNSTTSFWKTPENIAATDLPDDDACRIDASENVDAWMGSFSMSIWDSSNSKSYENFSMESDLNLGDCEQLLSSSPCYHEDTADSDSNNTNSNCPEVLCQLFRS